jgi:hypothetical protein
MTPEYHAYVERSLAAERAGDADAALEWHQSVPMFRKGRHRALLASLARLGDPPAWVWARWIAYQATRCEDGDVGLRVNHLILSTAEEIHGDLLDTCYRSQGDPMKVLARVAGESWAYHQAVAHEAGALVAFVDEFATGRLAEHADLARRWVGARMSGYQLGESLPGARLRVRDGRDEEWVEVLDLGARSCAPTGWVLGRLVPSGIGEMLMFDMPPLAVPEEAAKEVAHSGEWRGDWWTVVTTRVRSGRLSHEAFLREDYELASDVPGLDLLRFGTEERDHARVLYQLREGRDEVGRAAFRILQSAARGEVAAADQGYVAAAALNPQAFDEVLRQRGRGAGPGGLEEWLALVLEPARGRLAELVAAGRSAA